VAERTSQTSQKKISVIQPHIPEGLVLLSGDIFEQFESFLHLQIIFVHVSSKQNLHSFALIASSVCLSSLITTVDSKQHNKTLGKRSGFAATLNLWGRTLGHFLAITAMVGPPTYPAPIQQILTSNSSPILNQFFKRGKEKGPKV